MARKKTLEEEINAFLELWDCKKLCDFLRDIIPLFELYDVEQESDWVTNAVGEENEQNVRLIRTVYLLSRIAQFHAGAMVRTNVEFKNIWQRMEKQRDEINGNSAV